MSRGGTEPKAGPAHLREQEKGMGDDGGHKDTSALSKSMAETTQARVGVVEKRES